MSVSAVYRRVPADIYNRYLTGDSNGLIRATSEGGRTLDIDKSWDALHVFLTGSDEETDEPLSRAIYGMSIKIDRGADDDDDDDDDDDESEHDGFSAVDDDDHNSHGDDDYEDDFDDDFDDLDEEDEKEASGMFGLGPNIVVEISTALDALDADELVDRFRKIDFEELTVLSVDPEYLDDAVTEVTMYFEQLREFYQAAAEEGDGVLISMG
jgi:Domain of unknown function (DUF1877).